MAILDGLNAEQRAAAEHDESPLLIIAGAGSGKTTTLVHRVAHLISSGIDPHRILLLTFTRRAATMMTERTRKIVGGAADLSGLWSGTFHGTSVRLLRLFSQSIGLPDHFSVHDRSDSEDLIDGLLKKVIEKKGDKTLPRKDTALSIHSYQVNSQWPLDKVIGTYYPEYEAHVEVLDDLFKQYHKQKRMLGIADFDDLLLLLRDMAMHPQIGDRIRDRFQAVLVDEYQDTNVLQAQILAGLSPDGRGLTVVGDDAQSIYSFRASTVRNILDFPLQYPACTVVKLEQNYRSTASILSVSNALIDEATERFEKKLWSDRDGGTKPQLVSCFSEVDQAEFIVKRILRHKAEGIPLKDQAVLFRAAHHSRGLETELMRNHINFVKYGGLKFAESAHVKDLLAFLRLAENAKDTVAATRLLLLLPGVGAKRAAQALELLEVSSTGLEIWHQWRPPSASAAMWPKLVKLLAELAADKPAGLAEQMACVLTFYQPLLEERYDNPDQRMSDLRQLLAMADRFETRQQMLVDMTLDPPSSTADLPDLAEVNSAGKPKKAKKNKEPPLVLSTIHSAKGLEWPVVYVLNAMAGCIPLPRAAASAEGLEEERRLLYVAMTRAADYLYVSYNESEISDDFGFGYRRGWAPAAGGLTEFLTSKKIRKLFQNQYASHWKEMEQA